MNLTVLTQLSLGMSAQSQTGLKHKARSRKKAQYLKKILTRKAKTKKRKTQKLEKKMKKMNKVLREEILL